MDRKIGFLENANGERSSTRLFNLVYSMAFICIWAYLCWSKQEMIPFDPSALVPLGLGQGINALNKWIETNGNAEKVRIINAVIEKVKKQ